MQHRFFTILLASLFSSLTAAAQPVESTGSEGSPLRHIYLGSDYDAAVFSSSLMKTPGHPDSKLSTLRFTVSFGIVSTANYDFNNHFGLLSGLGIKNIGFIEKPGNDSTVKRRVYTIGVPLGFKVGNLEKRNYFFAGGGLDVPFNYKEKGFVSRSHKTKFNEWFSSRTPAAMPYLFAGLSFNPGLIVKVQYYPGNFLNTHYTVNTSSPSGTTSYQPYDGYDVRILYVSLGFDIHYGAVKWRAKSD